MSPEITYLAAGPDGAAALFARPLAVIEARRPEEVPEALDDLDRAIADGHWLAGFASYELGYCLEAKLAPLLPEARRLPLLRFGVHRGPEAGGAAFGGGAARLSPPRPAWTRDAYRRAFDAIKAYIEAGDIFQANLTFPMRLDAEGRADAIWTALEARQAAAHGAYLRAPGLPAILSRSPELFFATDDDRRITVKPMKGTAPRDPDPVQDQAWRDFLTSDPKNRAENLMIVDLMRNDVGRIAQLGSVRASSLFDVETLATVHQMTSTVTARLRPEAMLSTIFRALFPCGSVTGAPKIRAMEIIRELEPEPRELYCGAIGWAAPDGRSSFNVAIRTLLLDDDGAARLDVGGGLVHDSRLESEWDEALLKARFAAI